MDWTSHLARVVARLGEDATYTASGAAASSTVRGIYRQPYRELAGMIEGCAPEFACFTADMPNAARGDQLTLRGITWAVQSTEIDAVAGIVVLKLQQP